MKGPQFRLQSFNCEVFFAKLFIEATGRQRLKRRAPSRLARFDPAIVLGHSRGPPGASPGMAIEESRHGSESHAGMRMRGGRQ
jgi:hypothetical protein